MGVAVLDEAQRHNDESTLGVHRQLSAEIEGLRRQVKSMDDALFPAAPLEDGYIMPMFRDRVDEVEGAVKRMSDVVTALSSDVHILQRNVDVKPFLRRTVDETVKRLDSMNIRLTQLEPPPAHAPAPPATRKRAKKQ